MTTRAQFLEYRRRRGFQLKYSFRRITEIERIRPNNPLLRLVGKKHSVTKVVTVADMRYSENTADVSPDYVAVVKCNIEAATLTLDGNPAEFPRDEDPTSMYRTLRIDRFGRVVESQGKGPFFYNGIYPDEQVTEGHSWNAVDTMGVPKVSTDAEVLGRKGVEVPYTYTCVRFLDFENFGCAEIQVNGQYQEQVSEGVLLRFFHQGTIHFAVKEGHLVASNLRKTEQIVTGESMDSTSEIDEVKVLEAGAIDAVGGMRM